MKARQTLTLVPDVAGLQRASELLAEGGLVALPTETVYGLGADARNDRAVAGIFAAKGRPQFNPLIVHVPDVGAADFFCEFNPVARLLAKAFWPGSLTLVLRLKPGGEISSLVTAGLSTVAVRVPDHEVALKLLRLANAPIAAPSANPSGRVSPTTAEHVLNGLSGKIDAVLDGGACRVGLESTIIDCTNVPTLLRAGGVAVEDIEECLQRKLTVPDSDLPGSDSANEVMVAPGQLRSHYAPRGSLRLNAERAEAGETLLGFGAVDASMNLSPLGDLVEAASNLFKLFHELDAMGAEQIAVSPIPNHGLGRAINDRLRRAAAPRTTEQRQ